MSEGNGETPKRKRGRPKGTGDAKKRIRRWKYKPEFAPGAEPPFPEDEAEPLTIANETPSDKIKRAHDAWIGNEKLRDKNPEEYRWRRRAAVLHMKLHGVSKTEIGERLGIAVEEVEQLCEEAFAEYAPTEDLDKYRAMQLAETTAMKKAVWENALTPPAAAALVGIQKHEADLLGLQKPKNVNVTGHKILHIEEIVVHTREESIGQDAQDVIEGEVIPTAIEGPKDGKSSGNAQGSAAAETQ